MTTVIPGVVIALFGACLFGLGRWGKVNAESLVPVSLSEERRIKELRSVRRGVRSVLFLGGFLAVNGAIFVVVAATSAKS